MDKSSVTCTGGPDWWLSRTTMGGKERYPKQIRVGDLDRPRVYYPIDRDALLALADEMDRSATELLKTNDLDSNRKRRSVRREHAQDLMVVSSRIRGALGETK